MNRMRYLLDGISLLSRTYKEMEDARGENYNLFRVIDMTPTKQVSIPLSLPTCSTHKACTMRATPSCDSSSNKSTRR